jgi:copper/silver efflux system protein
MISSTLLTLVVIPAVFGLVKGFRLPPAGDAQSPANAEEVPTKLKLRIPEFAE